MNPLDQLEWDFYDLWGDLHTDRATAPPGVRRPADLPSPRLGPGRLSQWLDGDEEYAFSSTSASSQGRSGRSSHTSGVGMAVHMMQKPARSENGAETKILLSKAGVEDAATSVLPNDVENKNVHERPLSQGSLMTSGIEKKEGSTSWKRSQQTKPLTALEEAGRTALHRAVVGGHVDVVRALIAEGASVNRQDEHGNTPLHEAAWNGYSRTVELLIKARANTHAKNKNGFTPLHHAVQNGHSQSCRMLLMGGCWPDARNNYGDTSLHLAIKYGHVTSTRILISARCDVNQGNKDGRTALHIAAFLGLRKLTKILVEASADVNARDKDGKTPIDLARDKENPECILLMTSTPKGKRSPGRGRSTNKKDNSNIRRSRSLPAEGTNDKEQVAHQRKDKPVKRVQIQTSKDKQTKKHSPSIQVKSVPRHVRLKVPHERSRHHHRHPLPQQSSPPVQQVQTPPHLLPQAFPQMYHMVRDQKGNVQKIPVYQCYGCTPYLQQMDNKIQAHREELLAEIDDSHWALNSQLQQVERKCSHHAACLDQLCRERVSAEHTACLHRIDKRAVQDRRAAEADTDTKVQSVRESLQAWMEQKYCNLQDKLEKVTLSDAAADQWSPAHRDIHTGSTVSNSTGRMWFGPVHQPLEKAKSEGLLAGIQNRDYMFQHSITPQTEHNHLHPTDDEKLGTTMLASYSMSNMFPASHTTWSASMSNTRNKSADELYNTHQEHRSKGMSTNWTPRKSPHHQWQEPSQCVTAARPASLYYPQPAAERFTSGVRARSGPSQEQTRVTATPSSAPHHHAYDRELSPLYAVSDVSSVTTEVQTVSTHQYTRTSLSQNHSGLQDWRHTLTNVSPGHVSQDAAAFHSATPTYTVHTSFVPQTSHLSLSSEEPQSSQYHDSAISCDKSTSVTKSYLSYSNNDDSVLQSEDVSVESSTAQSFPTVSQQKSGYPVSSRLDAMSTARRGGGTEENKGLLPDRTCPNFQHFSTQGSHV